MKTLLFVILTVITFIAYQGYLIHDERLFYPLATLFVLNLFWGRKKKTYSSSPRYREEYAEEDDNDEIYMRKHTSRSRQKESSKEKNHMIVTIKGIVQLNGPKVVNETFICSPQQAQMYIGFNRKAMLNQWAQNHYPGYTSHSLAANVRKE